ncbi:MAG TPA: hypothetical protein VFY66_04625 [Anaerolineales bacterium]|nr:hypothetical protein [Anaerolineales bacterium]
MKKLYVVTYVGWSAILSGALDLIGFVFLLLFFALEAPRWIESGEPNTPPLFGTLNDASFIFVALFMIPVAVALNKMNQSQSPTFSLISLVIGMTGMLATAIIQGLYVPRLIQTAQQGILLGTALFLIGLWMILVNALGRAANLPQGLARLGIVAGVSIILLPLAGIAIGGSAFLDDPSIALSNPLFMFAFAAGVLGFSLGYAIWAILLGRLFLSGKLTMPDMETLEKPHRKSLTV